MKSLGPYVDVAIPHEAGHILVGKVLGFDPRGLDVEIVRQFDPGVVSVGNFATLASEPSDEQIPTMEPKLKAAFALYLGGGVAGNKFTGHTTIDSGADADRAALARFTTWTLEYVSEQALELIKTRRRPFRQLVSLIKLRYRNLVSNRNIESGRYTLLDKNDLDQLFSEYVPAEADDLAVDDGQSPQQE